MSTLRLGVRVGVATEATVLRRHRGVWTLLGAFWATLALQCGMVAWIARSVGAPPPFLLPERWFALVSSARALAVLFLPCAAVLLITPEFRQQTARLLVAGGVSRLAFIGGKVGAAVAVAGLFWAVIVTNSVVVGLLGGGRFAIEAADVRLLGGLLVACVGYAVAGLALGTLLRRSGPAIIAGAVCLILAEGLTRMLPFLPQSAAPWVLWMPSRVFSTLTSAVRYHPEAMAAVRTQAASVALYTPEVVSAATLYAAAGAQIVGLALVAYAAFAWRDL